MSKVRGHDQVVISEVAPTHLDERGSRSPWAPEQRPQSLIWTGRAVEMLWPSKYRCFGAMFGPAQGQMPFLTAKTADSGLEHKDMLKLDEKLD